MGSPTSSDLMSTQHTQLPWQVQVSSMPHLPLSLLDIPWYWHLQSLGISPPAETLPTTNGLFYTRVRDADLLHGVKLRFAYAFKPIPCEGLWKCYPSFLTISAASVMCIIVLSGPQLLWTDPKKILRRRFVSSICWSLINHTWSFSLHIPSS